jgi:hypothetical protein
MSEIYRKEVKKFRKFYGMQWANGDSWRDGESRVEVRERNGGKSRAAK